MFAASVEDTDTKGVIFEFERLACSDRPFRPDDIGSKLKAALAAMEVGPIAVKERMFLPLWSLSPRWGFGTALLDSRYITSGQGVRPVGNSPGDWRRRAAIGERQVAVEISCYFAG